MIFNMGQGGGGTKINGVIEQYRVIGGESVNAGDFIKHSVSFSCTESFSASYELRSVALDENRVALFYRTSTSDSNVYCRVVTLSDGAFTSGGTVTVQASYSGRFSVHYIGSSRVLFVYTSSSSEILYARIFTFSGGSIAYSGATILTSVQYSGRGCTGICELGSEKYAIFHSEDNYYRLLALEITVSSDNTITVGTETIIDSDTYSAYGRVSAKKEDGRIRLLYAKTVNCYYLTGRYLTVSNNCISAVGSAVQLSTGNNSGGNYGMTTTEEGYLLLCHTKSGIYNTGLLLVRCESDGFTVLSTAESGVKCYYSETDFVSGVNACIFLWNAFNAYEVLMTFSTSNVSYLGVVSIYRNGTEMSIADEKAIFLYGSAANGYVWNLLQPFSSTKYILTGGEAHNYGCTRFVAYDRGIMKSGDSIAGLAKTSGANGAIVDVYVPSTT